MYTETKTIPNCKELVTEPHRRKKIHPNSGSLDTELWSISSVGKHSSTENIVMQF